MPQNNDAQPAHQSMPMKAAKDFFSGFINAVLILIVLFFVLGSLWLDVFAIPAFFVFFRATVVTIASVRQVRNSLIHTFRCGVCPTLLETIHSCVIFLQWSVSLPWTRCSSSYLALMPRALISIRLSRLRCQPESPMTLSYPLSRE